MDNANGNLLAIDRVSKYVRSAGRFYRSCIAPLSARES
jgi:hypothetical protein